MWKVSVLVREKRRRRRIFVAAMALNCSGCPMLPAIEKGEILEARRSNVGASDVRKVLGVELLRVEGFRSGA